MNARLFIPISTRRTCLRVYQYSTSFFASDKQDMCDKVNASAESMDVTEPSTKRVKLSESAASSGGLHPDIDPDILKNLGMPYQPNPLRFKIDAQCGRARASTIMLPHGPLRTPVFMPVGTKGTIKGLTPAQVKRHPLACEIILANTYHMGLHPGAENLKQLGGLHKFMQWDRNILTDSGGFQMVSLLKLAKITEKGVEFTSPENDGTKMMLTPERSMEIQNAIGADIMMMLDDVVGSDTCDDARFAEATYRTVRWLDRCIKAHARPSDQALFAIVQGGLDVS